MRNLGLQIATVSLVFVAAQRCAASAGQQEADRAAGGPYLLSYFTGNGEDGLHLAYSHDGLKWASLKNDQSLLKPQVGSKLMRDPCICRGLDGTFHMVWTTGWWDKGIGIAHSADLIQWSEQKWLEVMSHEPDAANCWAPEIYYDEPTKKYLIFWSTTIPGRFPATDAQAGKRTLNHRIYSVTTTDFETYTNPRLFYDGGFNVIDATIVKAGDRHVMFLKDETFAPEPRKNIRIATADKAEGPYGPASKPFSPDWVEGPTAIKIGDYWHVYYDAYRRKRMEGARSRDLKTWEPVTEMLEFPSGCRHGTIFAVPRGILKALQNNDADTPSEVVQLGQRVASNAVEPRTAQQPDDRRSNKLRSTDDSTFPMQPVTDAAAWPARRSAIRRRILVAAGLHPMPKRSPLGAVVHGKVERDDYTVERVIFESFPGHYVTGSLYRPKAPAPAGGRRPAVLSPHGHWKEGRFHDHGLDLMRKEIAAGAERFEVGGRHVIQARCVQLARMGCVVLVYDMEGYADSLQLDHAAGPRPKDTDGTGYLFFSPRAELHGQTPFGLQTWNSIRALDFIRTLEDVDPNRIGVTGGSGGGTQSMILGAVDDRIAASMPAVMVSSGAQGGCTCENAQYLRIGQGNVDIAAATAPRPLGLICANDWTRALKADGHTELKALYKLLGCPDRYEAHFHFEFGHNYNSVNRQHMYHFMNRHLKLGLPEPIVERDYVPLDAATEATVWTEAHRKPSGEDVGQPHERKLTADWVKATAAALKAMSEEERRAVIAEGVTTMVGRSPAQVGPVKWAPAPKVDGADYVLKPGILIVTNHGEQLPVLLFYPKRNWNREVVVRLTDTGKGGVFGANGAPIPAVAALIRKGSAVAAIDLFGQGDFVEGGNALETVRVIARGKGDRPSQRAACYHFGYNPPLLVQRVHDVMSLVEFLRRGNGDRKPERIQLAAVGKQVGPVALMARFMLGERVDTISVDARGFTFDSVASFGHPMFLPGILRYGGMDALWKLSQPPDGTGRGPGSNHEEALK